MADVYHLVQGEREGEEAEPRRGSRRPISHARRRWVNSCRLVTVCCRPLLAEPLSSPEADRLDAWFRALADPTRLRLLSLIAGQGEACAAGYFVEARSVSQPTVSHHLQTLHESGFVEPERTGRWVYFRVRPDHLIVLGQTLASASQ